MKKLAMIAAGALCFGCLEAFTMPTFGLDAQAKYSSEYVVRGSRRGKHVFLPKAEVNMPVFEKGKAYAGAWAALGVDGNIADTRNEVSPYIGMTYDITDMFTLDAGYIHHLYTNETKAAPFCKRNTSELYLGVKADVIASPSLYFYYDCDAREVAIEGKVEYSFNFAQFGVNGLTLDLGAKLGYDSASKPFACKDKIKKDADGHKDYAYYGVNADLVYSFNEHAKARVGVAYEGNSAKKKEWANRESFSGSENHKNFVLFNASVDCSF